MDNNIKIPQLNEEYAGKQELKSVMPTIKSKYGSIVSRVAAACNLPEALIYNFIYIESRGQANTKSGQSIGLMQINASTCNYVIIYENKSKAISPDEMAMLKKWLGDRLPGILAKKYTWQVPDRGVTEADLYNPEFNILMGAMLISQLLKKTAENGKIRLDRVIWKYNRGEFSKLPSGDILEVYNKAKGSPTATYIVATLGKNGAMDYLTA